MPSIKSRGKVKWSPEQDRVILHAKSNWLAVLQLTNVNVKQVSARRSFLIKSGRISVPIVHMTKSQAETIINEERAANIIDRITDKHVVHDPQNELKLTLSGTVTLIFKNPKKQTFSILPGNVLVFE